jgi:hypothetical protein
MHQRTVHLLSLAQLPRGVPKNVRERRMAAFERNGKLLRVQSIVFATMIAYPSQAPHARRIEHPRCLPPGHHHVTHMPCFAARLEPHHRRLPIRSQNGSQPFQIGHTTASHDTTLLDFAPIDRFLAQVQCYRTHCRLSLGSRVYLRL